MTERVLNFLDFKLIKKIIYIIEVKIIEKIEQPIGSC